MIFHVSGTAAIAHAGLGGEYVPCWLHVLEVMDYSLSGTVQVEYFARLSTPPVRADLYNNRYVREGPRFRIVARALEVARCPWTAYFTRTYPVLMPRWQAVIRGEKVRKEALQQMESELNSQVLK